uniref:histidine kinase n=1 Tax=Fervidobacterium thailandense TaxID=1008305 RepID=A0A7C4VTT1_9BACT
MSTDFLEIFFQELREKGQSAIEMIKKFLETRERELVYEIYRVFHTIKGSASLVGLVGFRNLMHNLENYFKRYESGELELTDDLLARMLSIIPELLSRTTDISEDDLRSFLDILEGKQRAQVSVVKEQISESFSHVLFELVSKTLSVENSLMRNDTKNALREIRTLKSRLLNIMEENFYVRISDLLRNFDTLVIQEATLNRKKVKLELQIGQEKVERKDSQVLLDSLVHLVRNAIAHGIESPEERKRKGKSEYGTITLRSYLEGGELYLEVEDDGSGIDFERVRKKATEKGLGHLPPEEVIFVPGFSTKDTADGTAGRGVGLDAVRNFAMARGGNVEVVTAPGRGTKFIVHFPVKSFVVKVVVIEADGLIFAVETSDLVAVIVSAQTVDGKVKYKDKLYDISFSSANPRFCFITSAKKALLVDNIVGVFDGQISNESYGFVKGFVKNIFIHPLPVIDVSKISKRAEKSSKKRTILIVDDSFVTRSILSKFLRTFGYEVLEAKSGEEGVEISKKFDVDLVVCDVEMPGLDGFETTKSIKEVKPKLPVVIFSTLSEEQLIKGMEAGADGYLSKSEPLERLLKLIERLVEVE